MFACPKCCFAGKPQTADRTLDTATHWKGPFPPHMPCGGRSKCFTLDTHGPLCHQDAWRRVRACLTLRFARPYPFAAASFLVWRFGAFPCVCCDRPSWIMEDAVRLQHTYQLGLMSERGARCMSTKTTNFSVFCFMFLIRMRTIDVQPA